MTYTHYENDRTLCEKFKLLGTESAHYHRLFIKQVQYHRDDKWINILISNGVEKSVIEGHLRQLRDNTGNWDMSVQIWRKK